MSIMFVHSSLRRGGAERVISILANVFANEGEHVIIVLFSTEAPEYPLDQRIEVIQGDFHRSRWRLGRAANLIRRALFVRRESDRSRARVVLTFSVTSLAVSLIAVMGRGPGIVYSERSNPYESLKGQAWQRLKRPLSRLATTCVFQTKGAKGFYPVSVQRRSHVIANPVVTSATLQSQNDVKQPPRVMSAGRLIASKGMDLVIEAFGRVLPEYPAAELEIFGEGPLEAHLKELVRMRRLDDHVTFHGNVRNLGERMMPGNVFVTASLHEGMPNALIEALGAGMTCIASDCDFGPRELIVSEVNGLLTPLGDVDALSQALRRVMSDADLRVKWGSAAAESIRRNNSASVVARQYLDVIDGLQDRKGAWLACSRRLSD